MPASARIQTLGEPIWALDARPGDILVLNENLIPEWVRVADYVNPSSGTVADVVNALIAAGLMKGP